MATVFEIMMDAKKKGAAARTQAAYDDYQRRLTDESFRAEKAGEMQGYGQMGGQMLAGAILPKLIAMGIGAGTGGIAAPLLLGGLGALGSFGMGKLGGHLASGGESRLMENIGKFKGASGYGRGKWQQARDAALGDFRFEKMEKEAEKDMSDKMSILTSLLSGAKMGSDYFKLGESFKAGELTDTLGAIDTGTESIEAAYVPGSEQAKARALEMIQSPDVEKYPTLFGAEDKLGLNWKEQLPKEVIQQEMDWFQGSILDEIIRSLNKGDK